jgi:hypothetical protein
LTLLVPTEADRRVRKDLVCRVVKSRIPVGSFMSAGDDLLVPSPECCFLQLAQDSSVAELVLAGLELCGGYSIMPGTDGGFTSHGPIATSRKLERYLKKAGGLHGIKRAQRALRWIIDGSESPRETVSMMLFCLPLCLGGYGFELPVLNAIVHNSEQASALSHKGWHRCDLLWPKARVAIEYDSDAWHTGADRIAQDAAKRGALYYSNITVLTLTNKQVNDLETFEAFAHVLAKSVGKQLRRPTPKVIAARTDLRRLLLRRTLG